MLLRYAKLDLILNRNTPERGGYEKVGKRKLDSSLLKKVERRKVSGPQELFHVVITCSVEIYIPQGLTGSELGAHVNSEVKGVQGPVIKELKKLGIRSSRSIPLTNSIEARVTVEQLAGIENLESVASIRLSSLDHAAL